MSAVGTEAADRDDRATAAEVRALAAALLAGAGCADVPMPELAVTGHDPVLPSPFPLATGFAGVAAACGAALSELWRRRTGAVRGQRVAVDIAECAAALVSFRLARRNGAPMPGPGDGHPFVGLHPARDGRWVAIHGGFPSLEAPVRALLDGATTREAVAAVIGRRDAAEWEERFAAARQCCTVVRTGAEWRATPQGAWLADVPPVELLRIGDAPPEPLPEAGERPLTGLRVLDMTRILAGPVAGKFLAANGAEVLLLSAPQLPNVEEYLIENGHGKRSAWLDLNRAEDAARLSGLAGGADVLVQSYRTGALDRRGFGPESLTRLRPGLIHCSINCYGAEGPWRERPGWELLGQAASGMATLQGTPERPALVRAYPCDYTTGYLAALGVLAALLRRATEGGSWAVRVSLCRSGMYMHDLGARFPRPEGGAYRFAAPDVPAEGLERFRCHGASPWGEIGFLPPPVHLGETEPGFHRLSVPPGTDEPVWLPRGGRA
jgi:crotonobetainyl-CoA:carnitine CoA-transferase CaiB-like acyl-CoA transferase